jgi:hypothetical protein
MPKKQPKTRIRKILNKMVLDTRVLFSDKMMFADSNVPLSKVKLLELSDMLMRASKRVK